MKKTSESASEKTARKMGDSADKDIDMTSCLTLPTCHSSVLAGAILDVWLSGDHQHLASKLYDVTCAAPVSGQPEEESERIEILRDIAATMQGSTCLNDPISGDPRVGSWVQILRHFSGANARVC